MTAKEIMSAQAECGQPDETIRDAARAMKQHDIGFLPICEGDRLVGTVTDRDIVIRAIAESRGLETKLRDIMTPEVHYCLEDDTVEEVARVMKENDVHRVVVLSSEKRLSGVISIGDLAKADEKQAGDTYRDVFDAA